jgi:hypothetical protein
MLETTRLRLTRTQILAFRRSVQALDERLPHDTSSLRRAAWAGLQDSVPSSAQGVARRRRSPSRHGRRVSRAERHAADAEVASLPLSAMAGGMAAARWLA